MLLSLQVNTVHWHIVDQQSFPFDSKSHPLLSQKGAYSAQERYTPLDVAEVVEYSRSVGVRMMVEIDGPGHAAIWCKGYPEICPSGAPDGKPSCTEPLNPATNATYELLDDLSRLRSSAAMPGRGWALHGIARNGRGWALHGTARIMC